MAAPLPIPPNARYRYLAFGERKKMRAGVAGGVTSHPLADYHEGRLPRGLVNGDEEIA